VSAPAVALGVVLAVASGCSSAARIERGVFHSSKGYTVRLPSGDWRVQPRGDADLELERQTPPGAMLADATCGGPELGRPLPVLARHLTFGLAPRATVESGQVTIGGRTASDRVIQGVLDHREVTVEAVVWKDERCIHDFLYVAPAADFDAGRADFRTFVESFSEAR
jgi:hypothetical protein